MINLIVYLLIFPLFTIIDTVNKGNHITSLLIATEIITYIITVATCARFRSSIDKFSFHNNVFLFIWHFIKPRAWIFLILALANSLQSHATIIYSQALERSLAALTKFVGTEFSFGVIRQEFISYAALSILLSTTYAISSITSSKFVPWFASNLRGHFFSHLLKHSFFYFAQTSTGNLIARINSITSASIRIIQYTYTDLIPTLTIFVTTFILFLPVCKDLAYIILLWMLVHFVTYFLRLPQYIKRSLNNAKLFAKLTGFMADTIQNIFAIKCAFSTKFESNYFKLRQESDIVSYGQVLFYEKITNIMMDISGFLPILVLLFIFKLFTLYIRGSLSIGECLVLYNALRSMSTQIWRSTISFGDILIEVSRCEDALRILRLPYTIFDKYEDVPILGSEGAIELESVNFIYPLSTTSTRAMLFNEMNITIPGKSKTAFVGRSGSGKSTVLQLINRLYDPIGGTIRINGQDIKKVGRSYLSSAVSFIPQNAQLFERPVFENIGYGYEPIRRELLSSKSIRFTDLSLEFQEIIMNAAKKSISHDFILDLPHGYDTVYGRDVNLSGGQKQRIIIARALSNLDAQILLLDEATSALDANISGLIQKLTEEIGITVVSVVHNLSLVRNFDQIFVFDSGAVVEQGTHDELIKLNGFYEALWQTYVTDMHD